MVLKLGLKTQYEQLSSQTEDKNWGGGCGILEPRENPVQRNWVLQKPRIFSV
jgi:hypothetical protein